MATEPVTITVQVTLTPPDESVATREEVGFSLVDNMISTGLFDVEVSESDEGVEAWEVVEAEAMDV